VIRPCRRCCRRRRRRKTGWRTSITEHPAPAQALFATTGLFARAGVTHAVFLPVWAYPPPASAIATTCRTCAATTPIAWSAATGRSPGVGLPAPGGQGTRACLRALDRLEAATEQGRGLVTAVTNGRGCRMPSRRCCARPF
jgi:hypothetical protein